MTFCLSKQANTLVQDGLYGGSDVDAHEIDIVLAAAMLLQIGLRAIKVSVLQQLCIVERVACTVLIKHFNVLAWVLLPFHPCLVFR